MRRSFSQAQFQFILIVLTIYQIKCNDLTITRAKRDIFTNLAGCEASKAECYDKNCTFCRCSEDHETFIRTVGPLGECVSKEHLVHTSCSQKYEISKNSLSLITFNSQFCDDNKCAGENEIFAGKSETKCSTLADKTQYFLHDTWSRLPKMEDRFDVFLKEGRVFLKWNLRNTSRSWRGIITKLEIKCQMEDKVMMELCVLLKYEGIFDGITVQIQDQIAVEHATTVSIFPAPKRKLPPTPSKRSTTHSPTAFETTVLIQDQQRSNTVEFESSTAEIATTAVQHTTTGFPSAGIEMVTTFWEKNRNVVIITTVCTFILIFITGLILAARRRKVRNNRSRTDIPETREAHSAPVKRLPPSPSSSSTTETDQEIEIIVVKNGRKAYSKSKKSKNFPCQEFVANLGYATQEGKIVRNETLRRVEAKLPEIPAPHKTSLNHHYETLTRLFQDTGKILYNGLGKRFNKSKDKKKDQKSRNEHGGLEYVISPCFCPRAESNHINNENGRSKGDRSDGKKKPAHRLLNNTETESRQGRNEKNSTNHKPDQTLDDHDSNENDSYQRLDHTKMTPPSVYAKLNPHHESETGSIEQDISDGNSGSYEELDHTKRTPPPVYAKLGLQENSDKRSDENDGNDGGYVEILN